MADETQDAILEAAFKAMIDFGYDKATTKRIAEYAGVNEVTLFRKFGSKAKLLQELVRREAENFQTRIHHTGDLSADLEAIVTGYEALIRRRGRFMATLLTEATRRPELRGVFAKPVQTFGMLASLIARYQDDGKLRPEAPPLAAITLLAPVLMVTLISVYFPGVLPPIDPKSHVASYLIGRRSERTPHERD